MIVWIDSVHITANSPPTIVYSPARPATTKMHTYRSMPNIPCSTQAPVKKAKPMWITIAATIDRTASQSRQARL